VQCLGTPELLDDCSPAVLHGTRNVAGRSFCKRYSTMRGAAPESTARAATMFRNRVKRAGQAKPEGGLSTVIRVA
jgi:hypothetical protein